MRLALLFLAMALVTGCQRAEATRGEAVAARVNGVEIPAQLAATPQHLERAIDRELLVQEALRANLHQDEKVARAIEAARREVLARAWVERVAATAQKPSADEVRRFYEENTALFAERRIYRMQEISAHVPEALLGALRAEAAQAKGLDAVADWLRARKVRFNRVTLTQPAEEVPLRYLPRLAEMRPGEIAVFATPPGASVVRLLGAEDAPLSEAQAAPVIEQFLTARLRRQVAAAEARRLRGSARIEYAGGSGSNK